MTAEWVWAILIVMSGLVLMVMFAAGSKGHKEPPPEHVLKSRFAKGEIGEEEYVRRLAVLQHDRLKELSD